MPPLADSDAAILVIGCWSVFGLVWLITGFFKKRTKVREDRGTSWRYRLPAVLAALAIIAAIRGPFPLNMVLVRGSDALRWVIVLCSLAGLGLCLWARAALGRNWSHRVALKDEHELVRTGPYGLVRHPIYTGLLLMFVGVSLGNGRVGGAVAFALLFVSFWLKSALEEKLLRAEFPAEYPAYAVRVKRIVPFVV